MRCNVCLCQFQNTPFVFLRGQLTVIKGKKQSTRRCCVCSKCKCERRSGSLKENEVFEGNGGGLWYISRWTCQTSNSMYFVQRPLTKDSVVKSLKLQPSGEEKDEGAVHMEMLLCSKLVFRIVLANRPHGSCKSTFPKPDLRVEKSGNAALTSPYGRRICILCVSMTPSPHPSTSNLQPLNPAMSHNNNNGGLHVCVRTAEDIEPIRVTRRKSSAPLRLHWAKKDYGWPTSHFHLLLVLFGFSFCCLSVYSAKACCTCSVYSPQFLVNFKCHL